MIVHRYLIAFLAFSLLTSLCSSVIVEVITATAAVTAKDVLKKIATKFIDKAEDNLVDSALGALCLAAGLKNQSDEHTLDDIWKKVEQIHNDLTMRLKMLEYRTTKQFFNGLVSLKVKETYDIMIKILSGKSDADNIRGFIDGYNFFVPIRALTSVLNYLRDQESSYITPLTNLDVQFGGSRVLFGTIKRGIQALINQITAIRAFHFGYFGEENITNWINTNFAGRDVNNDDDINEITEKYIAHLGTIFPKSIKEKIAEIHAWWDANTEHFANTNPYWERGIVDGLVKGIMDRVNEEGKMYKDLPALAIETETKLLNITTNDKFDIIVTDSDVAVLRNQSNSVKVFGQGKPFYAKKLFDVTIIIFRSKPNVLLSDVHRSDMDNYFNENIPAKKMQLIETRKNDTVLSAIGVCNRPNRKNPTSDYAPIAYRHTGSTTEKHPVQSRVNQPLICTGQNVMPSALYLSIA